MPHPLLTRPALTLYTLAALVAAPYLAPARLPLVARLRLLQPREEAPAAPATLPVPEVGEAAIGATDDQAGTPAEPATPGGKQGLPFAKPSAPVDPAPLLDGPPPRALEDPSGTALDAFYAQLDRTERKEDGAITRITYYGDSVIASDWITGTLRRKLQARFGDAGHGFILIADAWAGYHHDNIARFASKGWKVSRVVGPYAPDGLYGLGGVSFVADGPGMYASVGTATSGDFGRAVSRFVVTYAEHPGGGKLSLKLDDGEAQVLSTAADATSVKTIEVDAPDGPHKLEIRSNGGGPVRVFHVVLERSGPGVVVDAVGIIGCRLRFLDKIDDAHWRDELARRDPSLIAFTYGANESGDAFAYPMDK